VGAFFIARPPGRARIETREDELYALRSITSPGLPAGRGLKLTAWLLLPNLVRHRPASRPGAD